MSKENEATEFVGAVAATVRLSALNPSVLELYGIIGAMMALPDGVAQLEKALDDVEVCRPPR